MSIVRKTRIPRLRNPARRGFLLSAVLGLLASRALTGCESSTQSGSVAGKAPQWLLKVTGDRDAVVRIGKDYLRAYPGERKLGVIMPAIEQALAGELEKPGADTADPMQAVAALQRVVRSDYQRNAVVMVEGWVLSRTEARLYGAVALLSA